MMTWWLWTLGITPEPVDAVVCARPVVFATPHAWDWSAEHAPIRAGTALVVRANADLLTTRDVGQRVLYVDGWPAEVLWTGGDRALVLAPVVGDLGGLRAWFGDETLPERVDEGLRARARDDARALPLRPPLRTSETFDWSATGGRDAAILALRGWMEGCETGAPGAEAPR